MHRPLSDMATPAAQYTLTVSNLQTALSVTRRFPSPDRGLGYGAIEQRAQSSVEAKETVISHSHLHAVDGTFVLLYGSFFIEL